MYLVKTVLIGGRKRVVPCNAVGFKIVPKKYLGMKVAFSKKARDEFPVGQFFSVGSLSVTRRGKGFLTATRDWAAVDASGIKLVDPPEAELPDAELPPVVPLWKVKCALDKDHISSSSEVSIDEENLESENESDEDFEEKYPFLKGFKIEEKTIQFILWCIERKRNVMIYGPKGCGKTDLAGRVFEGLGMEYIRFNCGEWIDPRSALIGNTHLDKEGTIFEESRFVEAVRTGKGILLDELTRAPHEADNYLFPVLDFQKYLPLDEGRGEKIVNIHPRTRIIATANKGSAYAGCNVLDTAFEDRFRPVELDYLSKDLESKLLLERCDISKTMANNIASVFESMRNSWKKGDIVSPPSTRMALDVGYMVSDGFDLIVALEMVILPMYDAEGGVNSERTIVKAILQKQ